MRQSLPSEFDVLAAKTEDMSDEVVQAFQYSLARLMVEEGRLSDMFDGGDIAHFRTHDGSEFELPNPHLPDKQARMVEDHLRWLLGF